MLANNRISFISDFPKQEMGDQLFVEKKFQDLKWQWSQGNFNAFLNGLSENYEHLRPICHHLLPFAVKILSSHNHFISPETISSLQRLPQINQNNWDHPPRLASCQNRIHFPVVSSRGIVREIRITRQEESRLDPEKLDIMDRVGSLIAASLRINFDYPFTWNPLECSFQILDVWGREDHSVRGKSLGLPLGLSLYSHLTSQPVPFDVSATGEVRQDGTIGPVNGFNEKIRILGQERHFISRVLVSDKQKETFYNSKLSIIPVSGLEEAIHKIFPERPCIKDLKFKLDLGQLTKNIDQQYRDYLLNSCMENCRAGISYLSSTSCPHQKSETLPALFHCYWKLGSCYCHKGRVKETRSNLQKAHKLYKDNPGLIPNAQYLDSQNNFAVLLKDIFQYQQAEASHQKLIREFEQVRGLDKQKGKNLSSLSQLCLAMGRFAEAEDFQKKAIRLLPEAERHRNYGYLAQIHTRSGQFNKAKRVLDKVIKLHNQHLDKVRTIDEETLAWIRAEYLYRRWKSQKRKNDQLLQTLKEIYVQCQPITNYSHALVGKFYGNALLEKKEIEQGLEILNQAASFLESQINPMFLLLASTIRAAKSKTFMDHNEQSEACKELKMIRSNLSSQKDIKEHFRPQLKVISRYLRFKKPSQKAMAETCEALKAIEEKVPY